MPSINSPIILTIRDIANHLEWMAMFYFIKELKQNLIPAEVTQAQASIIYANEADVLNVAMFGVTATEYHGVIEGESMQVQRCVDGKLSDEVIKLEKIR